MTNHHNNPSLARRLAARSSLWRFLHRIYYLLRWLPAQLKAAWQDQPTVEIENTLGQFTALPLTDTVSKSDPTFEAHLHRWVTEAPTGVFIDVGANVGLYTRLALTEGASSEAFAFEPNPAVYALLTKNIADNDLAAEAINAAVSRESGRLNLAPHSVHTGGTSVCGGGSGVAVASVSLDAFLAKREIDPEEISCIKIDIEGHELSALEGMQRTLHKMPTGARLFVEVWSTNEAQEKTLAFIKWLSFERVEKSGSNYLFEKQ